MNLNTHWYCTAIETTPLRLFLSISVIMVGFIIDILCIGSFGGLAAAFDNMPFV